MKNKLPLDAKISLFEKAVADYNFYRDNGKSCPADQTFRFASRDEDLSVTRTARMAAMQGIETPPPIKKVAFDTRRVDQEKARNPRTNLQYWHRAEPFINEDDNKRMKLFAKLLETVEGIKKDLGTDPHWFESYARVLHDTVTRTLRIKQADLDIFRPQLTYLEQLIFARYRLTMLDLEKKAEAELRDIILSKDETLMKRGEFLKNTSLSSEADNKNQRILIDGNKTSSTQDALVNAIFGNQDLRKDGERTVERTITITIRDNVID